MQMGDVEVVLVVVVEVDQVEGQPVSELADGGKPTNRHKMLPTSR